MISTEYLDNYRTGMWKPSLAQVQELVAEILLLRQQRQMFKEQSFGARVVRPMGIQDLAMQRAYEDLEEAQRIQTERADEASRLLDLAMRNLEPPGSNEPFIQKLFDDYRRFVGMDLNGALVPAWKCDECPLINNEHAPYCPGRVA